MMVFEPCYGLWLASKVTWSNSKGGQLCISLAGNGLGLERTGENEENKDSITMNRSMSDMDLQRVRLSLSYILYWTTERIHILRMGRRLRKPPKAYLS
jgi:hypothetical protein